MFSAKDDQGCVSKYAMSATTQVPDTTCPSSVAHPIWWQSNNERRTKKTGAIVIHPAAHEEKTSVAVAEAVEIRDVMMSPATLVRHIYVYICKYLTSMNHRVSGEQQQACQKTRTPSWNSMLGVRSLSSLSHVVLLPIVDRPQYCMMSATHVCICCTKASD